MANEERVGAGLICAQGAVKVDSMVEMTCWLLIHLRIFERRVASVPIIQSKHHNRLEPVTAVRAVVVTQTSYSAPLLLSHTLKRPGIRGDMRFLYQ